MTWVVHWLAFAENQLAALWLYAPDRKAITESANRIDQLLAADPEVCGVPYRKQRMLFQGPLAVTYTVSADHMVVEVLDVERIS